MTPPQQVRFDLQQLQRQHPEAFFQKLSYSQFKFTGCLDNLRFLICIHLFILLGFSIHFSLFVLFSWQNWLHKELIFDINLLILFVPAFLYTWHAQQQAKQSSASIAQRLQNALYLQFGLFVLCVINFYWIHSDCLNIILLSMLIFFSLCVVLIEANFKRSSSAIERIKLQKIRQLAYWSHQQANHHKTQDIVQTCDYRKLQQLCMQEEQQLLAQIYVTKTLNIF